MYRTVTDQLPSWQQLNSMTIALLFAATVAISTGSLLAVSQGSPEMMALFAASGLAILLLGFAVIRLTEYASDNETFNTQTVAPLD